MAHDNFIFKLIGNEKLKFLNEYKYKQKIVLFFEKKIHNRKIFIRMKCFDCTW